MSAGPPAFSDLSNEKLKISECEMDQYKAGGGGNGDENSGWEWHLLVLSQPVPTLKLNACIFPVVYPCEPVLFSVLSVLAREMSGKRPFP